MNRAFAALLLGLVACNYDVGECWVPGEETSGAGGGIINPTGAGGFGAVPRQPQILGDSWDLCSSQTVECTVMWRAGSSACRGSEASCTTIYQGQHASLDEAEEQCKKVNGVGTESGAQSCGSCEWGIGVKSDCKERCKKQCDKIHDRCHEDCNKHDRTPRCRESCNREYASCLRECENDC